MIIFDQLRISDDGKSLFLNAHVNGASYFDDMYIEKITICTEDQILDSGHYGDDFVYQVSYASSPVKEVSLVLTPQLLNEKFTGSTLSKNMFFVFAECTGTPAIDTPCTMDEATTVGVTFDYGALYNRAMNYTRELADTCNLPLHFIDFILNMEALKLSIATGNYQPAINYWKQLVGMGSTLSDIGMSTKPCGCHG